ncbi:MULTISPECIES: helix-turn-helix domain-containing protein [Thermomonospora]|uniref:Transcriptional regulator with XRE-family HTH domain n=1 Tax=Thermomonospora cellulosilytica TaxID=1411118 RepID=A0A7W3N5S6_9ACTN|nr:MULTISPECIES: helix-turn-helix transcriptional regulator [Thermomonospora]MBA9008001.1 transcriptional regulator with XRE-family HTH domain [Thermomonospora cellulosilytica]
MSSQVQQAREALGARLRELRRDARLTGRALAQAAGWHPAKVSRLEHGKQSPSEDDLREWCRLCGAPDEAADLIATHRNIEAAYLEWKQQLRTGLRVRQKASYPLYEKASVIRAYEPALIPGLLQTAAYAHAIMGPYIEVLQIPDDREHAVPARMERQRVLYEGDRRFLFVLEEAALRTLVGDTEVMLGQLDRVLAVMSLPRVSVGIVPALRERRIWPAEGFLMFDRTAIQIETISAQLTVTQPREIALYAETFERLQRSAVYGEQARKLIAATIEELRAI